MSVSAVTQVAQSPSIAAPATGDDTISTLFSYMLKHELGGHRQSGGGMMDTNPMLDMVGNAQAAAPQAVINTPAPAPTTNTNNAPTQSQQQAAPTNQQGQSQNQQSASTGNQSNTGNAGPQTSSASHTSQQAAGNSNSNNSASTSSNTQTGPSTQSQAATGQDEVTEATAAAFVSTIHLVQQTTAAPTVALAGPALQAAAAVGPETGPTAGTAGPQTGPAQTAAAAAAATVAAAADDESESTGQAWSLNFLNTVSAATPQIAQQSTGLSQLTGNSQASVSTQTTSNTAVTPTTTTLVPDAVLAISSFLQNGGQGGSTGSGSGDQQTGQQSDSNSTDLTAVDPDAMMLAQDAQALFALSSAIQTVAQELTAAPAQTQAAAPITAANANPSAAGETALPQSAAPASNAANQSQFAQQLDQSEQTQQPQATKQAASPSAVDQIKMQIEKGIAQGSSVIKVQMTPENMGKVEVKLEVQGGAVKATITADRPETLAVLKADSQGLVQSLQDAGLNADSGSLSFFLRGEQQQQRQYGQARQGQGQQGGLAEDDDPILGVSAASGASGASNGNLDISV